MSPQNEWMSLFKVNPFRLWHMAVLISKQEGRNALGFVYSLPAQAQAESHQSHWSRAFPSVAPCDKSSPALAEHRRQCNYLLLSFPLSIVFLSFAFCPFPALSFLNFNKIKDKIKDIIHLKCFAQMVNLVRFSAQKAFRCYMCF